MLREGEKIEHFSENVKYGNKNKNMEGNDWIVFMVIRLIKLCKITLKIKIYPNYMSTENGSLSSMG